MRRPVHTDRLAAAAYHEAGHAVMCRLMRLRITSIGIAGEGFYAGQTTHQNPFRRGKHAVADGMRGRQQAERAIMVCLAGALAQQKFAPKDDRGEYGGSMDVETASDLALRFFGSPATANAYMRFAETWGRQLFNIPTIWATVERLARALLREQTMSGRRAEAIIRGRLARAPRRRTAPSGARRR